MQLRLFLETILRRRRHYGEVCRELNAYSDRELNDMGLSRADISRIAREAADLAVSHPARKLRAKPAAFASSHSRLSA